jgi:transcription-repair coupling factor (superfamily II helicase)
LNPAKLKTPTAFSLDISLYIKNKKGIYVFLCDSYASAKDLYKNISFFSEKKIFFCEEIISISILYDLKNDADAVIILTPFSFFSKVPEPGSLLNSFIHVKKGLDFNRENFIQTLISYGYEKTNQIENENEFAVRGGIIDIFNADSPYPARIDFFDETVEEIRYFDLNTQISFKNIEGFAVFPVKPDYYEKKLNILDIIDNPVLYAEEPETELLDALTRNPADKKLFESQLNKLNKFYYYSYKKSIIYRGGNNSPEPLEEAFFKIEPGNIDFIEKLKYEDGGLNLELIKKTFLNIIRKGYDITIASKNEIHRERLRAILGSAGLKEEELEGKFKISAGDVTSGIISKKHKFFLIRDGELFREHLDLTLESGHRARGGDYFNKVEELNPGDFVVHDEFGIGKFSEIKNITVSGISSDYFALVFEGGDKLFVPADKIYLLHKYISSSGENSPVLSRLGNKSWEKAKVKAKKKIEDIAEDLKILYAKRMTDRGFAFSEEDEQYREFEESFEFEETEDQAKAIKEVLSDMRSNKPMDRLICGDVGFGKTEVAIRSAFKASMDGKQVALIAPTTLLVDQHYNNFKKRFDKYPIKVASISRFIKKNEEKDVIKGIKEGSIDIIIGTHKLLSEKIEYKDIGLLIIDEEQKFGALQKEKIKKIRYSIDVLAMSATPIPRTLYLSMSGIRDLSIITTPPAGRKNVITEISGFEDDIIKNAVFRELNRGGQIYFIENRISRLDKIYEELKRIMPDIRIGVVHGRLDSEEIVDIMHIFYDKGYDMLLSTAIIESGLDNPNVNTIIINNAERFGLSQLYQLRGRVGRSHIQAYCFLVTGAGDSLTAEQRKRLSAIKDYSELSSGFKLAMADLEIRGAGNILGGDQSGHINEVGLEMCMQMLREEIEKIKGTILPVQIIPEVKVNLSAYIPDSYIGAEKVKMSLYRKLSNCAADPDIENIRAELKDRFGKIEPPVENLLKITGLKSYMKNSKVQLLEIKEEEFILEFHESAGTIFEALIKLVNDKEFTSDYIMNFIGEFKIRFRLKKAGSTGDKLERAKIILQRLRAYVNI